VSAWDRQLVPFAYAKDDRCLLNQSNLISVLLRCPIKVPLNIQYSSDTFPPIVTFPPPQFC